MTPSPSRPRSSRTIREKRKELLLGALAKVLGGMALILMVAAVFRVAVSNLWEVPEKEVGVAVEVEGGLSVARGVEEVVAVPKAVAVSFERAKAEKGGDAVVSGIEGIESKRVVIGEAVAGFFGAESVDEKVRWVRDPERVRPLMADFYATHEWTKRRSVGLGWVKSVGEAGIRLGYVEALFDSGEPMALIVEESEDGRVRVDWESSVRYGELPWREFVQAKPGRPTLLRVLASRSERVPSALDSEISGAMRALSVRHPSDSEPLEAIFDAADPVLGALIEQLEAGAWKNVPVTLRLCFPGAETNSETKMARVTAVEGRGWLILPQKRS